MYTPPSASSIKVAGSSQIMPPKMMAEAPPLEIASYRPMILSLQNWPGSHDIADDGALTMRFLHWWVPMVIGSSNFS